MSMDEEKKKEKVNRYLFIGAGVGTALLWGVTGWWIIGIPCLVGTGYLGYKWFSHRAKWGMKF